MNAAHQASDMAIGHVYGARGTRLGAGFVNRKQDTEQRRIHEEPHPGLQLPKVLEVDFAHTGARRAEGMILDRAQSPPAFGCAKPRRDSWIKIFNSATAALSIAVMRSRASRRPRPGESSRR